MNFKAALTLILGLVFQLSQVLPGAVVTPPCAKSSAPCACCMAAQACHCATDGESEHNKPPAPIHAGDILKIGAINAVATHVTADPSRARGPSNRPAPAPPAGPSGGYSGVRLSVAFCSFVI